MSAGLISGIAQVFNSDLVARIATSLGLDRSTIEKALSAGTPALLAALGSLASRPGGAATVNAEVARQEQHFLQNLGQLGGGDGMNTLIDAGSRSLKSLLGGQTMSALTNAVSRYTGVGEVGTGNLMGVLGPIVMSVLSDRQRGSKQSVSDILLNERDSIARALPSGLSDALAKTGVMDWITSSGKTAQGSYAPQEPVEFRRTGNKSPASKEASASSGWMVPALALLAAGALAWLLLGGPRTKDVAKTVPQPPSAGAPLTTGALPDPKPVEFPSLQSLSGIKVGETDIGAQVTGAFNEMRAALAGIHDEASAQTAVDPLKRSADEIGRISGLANQLSPEMRKSLAAAIAAARPTLDGLCDKAMQIPGVATLIKPVIDNIRVGLDTLATA